MSSFSPAHVQFCDCHGDVIDRKPPLKEEVFAHVSESRGRINSVPADPIPLQIRSGIATPRYDDPGYGDLHAGALQQLVPQVHPVPEGDDVPLDGNVVLPMESVTIIVDYHQNLGENHEGSLPLLP